MSRTGLSESLQLHWQRSPLAQRWQTLPARDRLALVALSVFLLLVLFYLALWQPVQRQAQAARAAFEEQRALYAYMQSRAPQVQGRDLQPRASLDPARLQGVVTVSPLRHLPSPAGGHPPAHPAGSACWGTCLPGC